MPGIFDGECRSGIERLGDARTRFTQCELFSGLLAPLFAKSLKGATGQGFEAMNLALKERAERKLREA